MKNKGILSLAEDFEITAETIRKANELILPSFAGILTFPTVLGLMQNYVWKSVNLTAHKRLAPVGGMVSLIAASSFAAVAFALTECSLCGSPKSLLIFTDTNVAAANITSYGLLCVFAFKMFGGRLRNLCPSHILHPGSYAVKSVPLPTLTSAVSKARLGKIQKIGEQYGCHTCGKRYNVLDAFASFFNRYFRNRIPHVGVNYFGDHSPPVALAEHYPKRYASVTGKLLPQCKNCSYFQASQVRLYLADKLPTGHGVVTHASRFKLHKLWMPFPVLIQYGLIAQLIAQYLS